VRKVKWGVIGVAKIAVEKVIPAMQRGEVSEIAAIASRDLGKAKAAAEKLGIPQAYGSYEHLLADSDIEAIYNPPPNEGHVPWTLKALAAGKHVLCEKPIALDAEEARLLIDARNRSGKLVAEAFMGVSIRNGAAPASLRGTGRLGKRRRSKPSSPTGCSIRTMCATGRRAAAAFTTSAATPSSPRASSLAPSRPGSWRRSTGTRSSRPTDSRALFSSSPAGVS